MIDRDTKLLHVILQEWSDEYNKTQTTRVGIFILLKKVCILIPNI
jgi:hypothetical protein